uniref:Conotoxin Di1.1 n=1 Tax=Conus distans TaxID=72281 RepID=M9PMU0_CONDI|nr:conotoxin Di1.1 [Conus distans]
MFTVFLLVVLATTVVSFTSDHAFYHKNRRTSKRLTSEELIECCVIESCHSNHIDECES